MGNVLRDALKEYRIKPELNKKIDYIMLSAAWWRGVQSAKDALGVAIPGFNDKKAGYENGFTLKYFKDNMDAVCNQKCTPFNLFFCTTPNMFTNMIDALKVNGKINGGDDIEEQGEDDSVKIRIAKREWFQTANVIDIDLYNNVSMDLFNPENTKIKEMMPKSYVG